MLSNIIKLKDELEQVKLDALEEPFAILSEKGDMEISMKAMIDTLAGVILNDLGVKKDAQNKDEPFLKSAPYAEPEKVPP